VPALKKECVCSTGKREEHGASLSYGTSLFAGAFLDPKANVVYYGKFRLVYAIIIPAGSLHQPFYIPKFSPIQDMLSKGEFFHARSLIPAEFRLVQYPCIHGLHSSLPVDDPRREQFYSNLDAEALRGMLLSYHKKAFRLSSQKT
jgi:hypothetical protein